MAWTPPQASLPPAPAHMRDRSSTKTPAKTNSRHPAAASGAPPALDFHHADRAPKRPGVRLDRREDWDRHPGADTGATLQLAREVVAASTALASLPRLFAQPSLVCSFIMQPRPELQYRPSAGSCPYVRRREREHS
ncbi:hypothetical protein C8Q78DRAFT_1056908 [Trametes maxima]|nr:hypothetical protein C8Q78DRAFT_1056908 [Trametes maxima]